MVRHFHSVATWSADETQVRLSYIQEVNRLDLVLRSLRSRVYELRKQLREMERSPEARDARAALNAIETEAEMSRLTIVRNAMLTVDGLQHTNHRPSAWWMPMVDSSGGWFRRIAATTRVYIQPLVTAD